jgi:hypothetical protein
LLILFCLASFPVLLPLLLLLLLLLLRRRRRRRSLSRDDVFPVFALFRLPG